MSNYYFNFFAIPPLVASIFLFILAFLVLLRNPREKINRSYFYMNFSAFIWQLGYFFVYISRTEELADFWQRIVYLGVPFLAPTMYHFSINFFKNKNGYKFIIPYYIFAMIFSLLSVTTNFLIIGVKKYFWGYYTYVNIIPFSLFLAFWMIPVLYAIINLYIGFKKTDSQSAIERQQKKYLSLAFIVVYLASFDFVSVYGVGVYPLGYLSVIICLSLIAYSIVKFRLMDIRFVISRSVLYSLLTLIVAAAFATITFVSSKLFENLTPGGTVLITIIASFLIVIFLDPLKRLLAQATDRVFYKGKIDYQNVLFQVGEIIAREINLTKLARSIQETLKNKLKIKELDIIHKCQGENFCNIVKNNEVVFRSDSILLDYLEKNRQVIVTEELPRRISEIKNFEEKAEIEKILNLLDERKCSMVVPVRTEHNLIAVFLIGSKLSGGAYNQEDINFFNILSPQIATALEKSRLYQEIQDFNISLQERIDKATRDLRDINLTLAEKNRHLQALQRITNLITRTLDFKLVTQGIANGISAELGYVGGLLSFINPTGKYISPAAISMTPKIKEALSILPQSPEKYRVSLSSEDNLGVRAIKTGKNQISQSFYDFVKPALKKDYADSIQEQIGGKTIIAVPVYAENKVIGVIDFVLAKDTSDIKTDEMEMMHSLADQVGIVYRNLQLIRKIQETNKYLADANVRLQHLDEAKSEFLSIASHQLRTPLTAIKGYLAMLLDGDFGAVSPKVKKVMRDVFESSNRLARLINVFLNVSRIEAGRLKMDFQETDLVNLLASIVKDLKSEAKNKKLELELIKPEEKIPKIKVDNDKIKDIVYNLVDNAIKYTPQGNVKVRISTDKNNVRVSVSDTGLGIDPEEAKELFAKFVRGEGIARINTDGSGLGLYIAKKLVESHHGKIWVESKGKGKGSTFNFTLPLEQLKNPTLNTNKLAR